MSLRSRSHVKASMVLTRADHLFIHNYIRSLLNNILSPTACVSDALTTEPHRQVYMLKPINFSYSNISYHMIPTTLTYTSMYFS